MRILELFFAILGLMFVLIEICDYLFYRKFRADMSLVLEVFSKSEQELIDMLEIITTVRRSQAGKCAISKLIVLTSEDDIEKNRILLHYMQSFKMEADFYRKIDGQWRKFN